MKKNEIKSLPLQNKQDNSSRRNVGTSLKKEGKAQFKFVRMPARKIRIVLNMVRGKNTEKAFSLLKFTNKEAARVIEKLLKSAVDSAVKTNKSSMENLYVKSAYADNSSTLKRFMPRAQGRAAMIRKRMCHISIIVGELKETK